MELDDAKGGAASELAAVADGLQVFIFYRRSMLWRSRVCIDFYPHRSGYRRELLMCKAEAGT